MIYYKQHMPKASANKPLSRSLRSYQRVAILFVVLAAFLLLAVLYLSVSRAVVRVTPVPERTEHQFTLSVVPDASEPGEMTGYVRELSLDVQNVFTLPEENATPVDDTATGFVRIVNESSRPQPLVATTRFLSESQVLFRLDEAVTVPANGEVTAAVSADEPGAQGEIEPSRFSIPGLNSTRQNEVYGVSDAAMVGGVRYVRALSEQDIAAATEALSDIAEDEALEVLKSGIDENVFNGISIRTDLTEISFDAELGDEVGAVSGSANARVTTVFYPRTMLDASSQEALTASLREGFKLATIFEDELQASPSNIDIEAETADMDITVAGMQILSERNTLFDVALFLGKSEEDVRRRLESSDLIESVNVQFQPFWLKRMPTLKDHIEIKVINPL
jgi:hypothetical protein